MSSRSDSRVPYPLGVSQAVSVAATSAATAAGVDEQTRRVEIYCSVDAYYAFGGSTVTATTSSNFIAAGQSKFLSIRGGQYVAFIRDTADGTAHVSEFGY